MTTHAKLSASGASQWLACPGSVRLSAGLPEPPPSQYAMEGIKAHHEAEKALKDGSDASTPELQVYLDYVRLQGKQFKRRYLEKRVNLNKLSVRAGVTSNMFGTADCVLVNPLEIEVIDLKMGRMWVSEYSPQLLYYALGAVLLLTSPTNRPRTITCTIVQPRAGGDAIRSATYTWLDVIRWAYEVLFPGAIATQAPDAPLVPGESQCKFCRAAGICPALQGKALSTAKLDFDIVPPNPEAMSDKQLGEVLDQAELLDTWVKAVRAEASHRLDRGQDIPNWKLAAKRAMRKWVPGVEEKLWRKLIAKGLDIDDFAPRKTKSPAAVGKLLADPTVIDGLVIQESSGSTLVPASDPRPAILKGPTHEFGVIDDDIALGGER